jgi:transcription elongation GreA/GreB family factor
VQLLLTDEQAELAAAALLDAEEQLKEDVNDLPELTSEDVAFKESRLAEIQQVGRLFLLFQDASERPAKYPPTGKMASSVRTIVRRAKGASQPNTRRNRRKARQAERRAYRKFTRLHRREIAEQYNAAVEQMEKEQAEYEAAQRELEERIADQPTFTIRDGWGNDVMVGVPAEFILDAEGRPVLLEKKSKLHLPFRKEG